MKASLGTLWKRAFLLAGPLLCCGFLFTPHRSTAAGVVTSPTQENLLQALQGGGTVTFDCDGTIVVSNVVTISTNTILDATGHAITLKGSGSHRLFRIAAGASLSLMNVSVVNGVDTTIGGGAILNEGTLNVNGGVFSNNVAHGFGGAIFSSNATITLNDVTFVQNASREGSPAKGGAIYVTGGSIVGLTVLFSANQAEGTNSIKRILEPAVGRAQGAAIYLTNTVATFASCSFHDNVAQGGVGSGGVDGNKSSQAEGGAIYNFGNLQITNCAFVSNKVIGGRGVDGSVRSSYGVTDGEHGGDAFGGAIYNAGTMILSETVLENNTANGNVGGAGSTRCSSLYGCATGANGNTGDAYGGAIFNSGTVAATGVLAVVNRALGNNATGGALGNTGGMEIEDADISNNISIGSVASAGGIWNSANLTLTNAKVTQNKAISGTSGAAAGVYSTMPFIQDSSSVIATNTLTLSKTLGLTNVSIGSFGLFEVSGADVPPIGFTWYTPGSNLVENVTENAYIRDNLQATDIGTHFAVISYNTGRVAQLDITIAPMITSQSTGGEKPALSYVTLNVTATGLPLIYHWYLNGAPVPGATGTNYFFQILPSNLGSYTAVVSNSLAMATSAPIVITMEPTAPLVAVPPSNITSGKGSSVTLAVAIVATEPAAYQWRFNGTDIPGATSSTYAIPKVWSANTGTYSLFVSNAYGSIVTSNIILSAVSRGDFNNDGHTDILLQHTNGTVACWSMNGTNILNSEVIGKREMRALALADFTGDNATDCIWQWGGGRLILQSGLTNGGHYGVYGIADNWSFGGANDVNSDSSIDILWQNKKGQLAAWLMSSNLFLRSTWLRNGQSAGLGWKAVGTGDFNNDQKTDVLFHHTTGKLAVWFMDGTNFMSAGLLRNGQASAPGWRVVGLNDLNDDAESDILWQNSKGQIAIWFMNQTNFVNSVLLRNGQPLAPGWRIIGVR